MTSYKYKQTNKNVIWGKGKALSYARMPTNKHKSNDRIRKS